MPSAGAAPCAGFTDVDSTSPFCASVEWLKNQGITVGCTSTTLYCPDNPVTRLAMAVFLKRFADAGTGQAYSHSLAPTCPFLNGCYATFPAVPVGKRLLLTNVRAMFFSTNTQAIVAVHRNGTNSPLLAFPVSPFPGAYYGPVLSTNQDVEIVYEAGETPILEIGVPAGVGGIFNDSRNRLGLTGYLVSVPP
jgi:hypothetical protein